MGCLLAGLAALLALAIPATIARASLVGAYVVLALLALAAAGALVARARATRTRVRRGTAIRLAMITGAYAVIVTVIHFVA